MDLTAVLLMAAAGAAILAATMLCVWQVQRQTGHTGWIDVFWTWGVGGAAVVISLFPFADQGQPHLRQIAVAAFAGLWSLRLGGHIFLRTRIVGDDPRYRHWINQWGVNADRKMFWQLQLQAFFGALLSLCIGLAAQNPHPALRLQDILGAIILVTGIAGEAVADQQMRRFREQSAGTKAICDIGLWRLSRHPNYFFEWLCWCAYPVVAIDFSGANPYGALSLIAPVCMYWLLTAVSGIPPLEEYMLRTRGAAFAAYQRRTNAFFPFWPKPEA